MTLKLQAQVLTSVDIGAHRYEVLDIRVNVGGEDIPVFRDETGRLCVLSRLITRLVGYKQKDTLNRMIQRRQHHGFREGFTHRLEPVQEFHNLTTRLALNFPVLKGLYFRVRTPEVLLYSQSFALLTTLSKLDLRPAFDPLVEVESALQTKSQVSEDEAMVDELASVLVDTDTSAEAEPEKPKPADMKELKDSLGLNDEGALAIQQAPAELGVGVDDIESAVSDLRDSIDIPVEPGLLKKLTNNPGPARVLRKEKAPATLPSPRKLLEFTDKDLPGGKEFVPPGYPEYFEDVTGGWVGTVYSWVLARELDPHKRGVGPNLPNIPQLLRTLLREWGFIEESGAPSGDGRYFIYQERTGSLQFNVGILPRLLCAFLVTNPKLDYRGYMVAKDVPVRSDVKEVRALARRIVREMLT